MDTTNTHSGNNLKNFTQIPNSILDDATLSLQEKGLLAIFYRNSDTWQAHVSEIKKRSENGKGSTTRLFKKLEQKGHVKLVVEKPQLKMSNGQFSNKIEYWKLLPIEGFNRNSKPLNGNRITETDNRLSATNNTNDNKNNMKKTEEIIIKEQPASTASLASEQIYTGTGGTDFDLFIEQQEEFTYELNLEEMNDDIYNSSLPEDNTFEADPEDHNEVYSETSRVGAPHSSLEQKKSPISKVIGFETQEKTNSLPKEKTQDRAVKLAGNYPRYIFPKNQFPTEERMIKYFLKRGLPEKAGKYFFKWYSENKSSFDGTEGEEIIYWDSFLDSQERINTLVAMQEAWKARQINASLAELPAGSYSGIKVKEELTQSLVYNYLIEKRVSVDTANLVVEQYFYDLVNEQGDWKELALDMAEGESNTYSTDRYKSKPEANAVPAKKSIDYSRLPSGLTMDDIYRMEGDWAEYDHVQVTKRRAAIEMAEEDDLGMSF